MAPGLCGYADALGTLGGGNHFAELLQIDEIYQPDVTVNKKRLMLLVHSGSRGLGQAILQQHVERFGHHGLLADSEQAQAYLHQHQQALDFATLNRQLIAQRIFKRLGISGDCLLDLAHNFLAPATINGISGWIHRKGATPADQGMVVIPGSRGDHSYIVQPLPSASSLYSLAHGAGRKWQRSECKDRLSNRFSVEQLSRTRFGSRVICRDRQLIYQEAPEAYKPIDSVIGALQQAGLIMVLARLKPLLTYKTSGRRE